MVPSAVLVVEDEHTIRALLGAVLPHFGLPVFLAGSGAEALALYPGHRHEIGVALIDVQMPEMDGPQVLAALRELDPNVPAVFMSGNMGQYTRQELLSLAAHVLDKPFLNLAELAGLLREAASSRQPPALSERRREPRREGNPLPVLLSAAAKAESAEGVVLNRSLRGLCLQVGQGEPPGAVLHVRPASAAPAVWMPVEVKHCRQQNHHWILGCQFLGKLSAEEFQQFGYVCSAG